MLESLYLKVFINIVVRRSDTEVYVEFVNKNGEVVQSECAEFVTQTMSDRMYDFINRYIKESPFYYISILDTSDRQGAAPTCKSSELQVFCDTESTKSICFNDQWTYYTSLNDLRELQKKYESVGLDFIFSPFVLLAKFYKEKIDSYMAMYVLVEENYVTLSVYKNSELLYAQHIDMQHSNESDELIIDEPMDDIELDFGDEGIDLEDIDVADDSLESFDDIEDLENFDDISDFADSQDIEEEFGQDSYTPGISENGASLDNVDGFSEDYQRFSNIQSSINSFYKDRKYKSDFIESIYIADGVGVTSELKRYLEEEMFLNVYIRSVNLPSELCELAKADLNEV